MTALNDFIRGVISDSSTKTIELAKDLASQIPPDTTLLLRGDLGAGKTTFVKGLALAWGIEETITSPTFNIYQIYASERQLIHMDAYRLPEHSLLDDLMLEDFMQSPYCLAIEWPERISRSLPIKYWNLQFRIDNRSQHHIQLAIP
jgi:tRNA threonylcarbamoyladenosine biosynthesis protein TsaE